MNVPIKMTSLSHLLTTHSRRRKRESNPQPCYGHHFRGGWIASFTIFSVGVVRFELTTCTLSECRANLLRHTPVVEATLKDYSTILASLLSAHEVFCTVSHCVGCLLLRRSSIVWLQRHMYSIAVAPCCKHIHCIHKLWLHCRNQRDFHLRLFMCQKAVA